jgi:plasmid maintenance system antidote protein VapI
MIRHVRISFRSRIDPDRLGRLFSMDSATWIRMQEAVNVWDTLKANPRIYEQITPLQC